MKNRFEIGEALETEIVAITDSTIFLDLSAKSEGVLDRAELADENGNVSVKEGDKITVYFTGEVRGEMRFTTKISGGKADKSMIENAYKNARLDYLSILLDYNINVADIERVIGCKLSKK